MKERKVKKGKVISIRVTDEERKDIQALMEKRNMNASLIMREALSLFAEQWQRSRCQESAMTM